MVEILQRAVDQLHFAFHGSRVLSRLLNLVIVLVDGLVEPFLFLGDLQDSSLHFPQLCDGRAVRSARR